MYVYIYIYIYVYIYIYIEPSYILYLLMCMYTYTCIYDLFNFCNLQQITILAISKNQDQNHSILIDTQQHSPYK